MSPRAEVWKVANKSDIKKSGDEIIEELISCYPQLRLSETGIKAARSILSNVFLSGGKLLICGNGGSAADSEHCVGELMKSFRFRRPIDANFKMQYCKVNGGGVPKWLEGALPAIALSSHSAFSTAFCNDEDSVGVFAQQVYGYGEEGDALLAISTSGNSRNIVEAVKVARAKDMRVIALTGRNESILTKLVDTCIRVSETETYRVQELHLPVYHALCGAIEADVFGGFND